MTDKTLENVCIWITRPVGQGDNLSLLLKDKGAKVLHIPMIQIEPLQADKKALEKVSDLKGFDMVFFISTNAAQIGMDLIETELSKTPKKPAYFAPGPGTARVLESYGMKVSYPEKATRTEGLLILPEIRKILQSKSKKKKRALIFRGKGGRELLAKSLRGKGVDVSYVELYRRVLPKFKPGYLQELLQKRLPDGIVFSSAEAIHNFITLFEKIYPEYKKLPAFVTSDRLENISRKAGFETVRVMQAADDKSVASGVEEAHG